MTDQKKDDQKDQKKYDGGPIPRPSAAAKKELETQLGEKKDSTE